MQERMRHIVIGGIATSLGGALFVFLVWKAGPATIWQSLSAFGVVPFLFFVSLSLLNFGLYTLRWKIILEEVEKKKGIRYVRLFLHRMSGFAAGYLTPAAQVAGEPVRVALLATEGISSKTATSSVVLDLAFEISAFVLYVVLGIVLALSTGVGAGTFGLVAYIILGTLLVLMTVFFVSVAKGWNIFHRVLQQPFFNRHKKMREFATWLLEVEGTMTRFFAGRAHILAVVIILSLVMTGFRAVEVWFIAQGFGQDLTLSGAILLSTIPGLVLFAPIPGGLGLFEASMAAMLGTLGISTPAIAFTMIIRLRDFLFIGVGALHGIREGAGYVSRKET
ncbi:MAG: lysylphosphatidylglycerol synthase transmembrane domain-containing protein [Patescibacteria group bacterium]